MIRIKKVLQLLGILGVSIISGYTQTNLQFTAIAQTEEQAIQLNWASKSNEVYEIDEADSLINTNAGSTTWNDLYDDYPSQGTNTFWLDTGNYFKVPAIVHPKNAPMRFYRIVDKGPDTTSDEPTVTIVSPTNDFIASGQLIVAVSGSTDQATLYTKLYVDGQEMPESLDGTNFVINTCEWPNGPHILFATAKCMSDFAGSMGVNMPDVAVGHGVSAFVPVTFNNLITRISFSEPFFNPDAGQTQQVSAVFSANSDWTLNIADAHSNIVFTTSGSGTSMQYNWDGNGTGDTNLPAGTYYYYISAATNGEANDEVEEGSSEGSSPSASAMDTMDSTMQWYATTGTNSVEVLPLAIYPPGFGTNGLTIFEATPAEIRSLYVPAPYSRTSLTLTHSSGFSPNGVGTGGMSSQTSPAAPERPPGSPVVRIAGYFGVAYQSYTATNARIVSPLNGFPTIPGQQAQHVKLDTNTQANVTLTMPYQPAHLGMANNFIAAMESGAWQPAFIKVNDDVHASDLQGSGNIFNQVNLGLFMGHGDYGTTIDYNANQTLDTYIAIESIANNSGTWVRLSDMHLGSLNAPTNSLRWMALFTCNSLRQANWNSMNNGGQLPITSNLHLLLGTDSTVYPSDDAGSLWARAILGLSYPFPQQIRTSWSTQARIANGIMRPPGTIRFATGGWESAWNDTLQSTNSTSGDLMYESVTVYP